MVKIIHIFFFLLLFPMSVWAQETVLVFKGAVTDANGKGIANVVVTDGLRCVTTDKNGIYHLPNLGNTRFVYITTPAGYLTDCEQTIPRFYQEIDLSKTNEYNFRLKYPKDDSKHLFVLEADVQAGLYICFQYKPA